ncbi:MAG: Ig-like domain-containing protein, partial [Gammaproteobacteria bacterium]|nr:Ig-like domain-containing protein [Gammaproteobacteria bacterium]
GTLSGEAPNLTYTPNPDYFGPDSFTFTASAGVFNSNPATITITVDPVNDQPVFTALAAATVTELDSLSINAGSNLNDPDDVNDGTGQILWSLTGAPEGMTISTVGLIAWTPGENTAGNYDLTVQVIDGGEDGSVSQGQGLNVTVNLLDSDEDTVADYNDNCPADANLDQANLDEDAFGDICDGDDDGDGISDIAETANGLNPRDASDALLDLDGDGLSNLEEFNLCLAAQPVDTNCLAISVDAISPVITVDDMTVLATGYVTDVDIPASAVDANDGDVPVTPDQTGPFRPGRYTITWSAVDSQGNSATVETTLDVLPRVTLAGTIVTGEGRTVTIPFSLNGSAPEYPVILTYSVSGTADSSDHNLSDGGVQIDAGTSVTLDIDITADEVIEGDEEFTITLTGVSSNVGLVDASSFSVLIVERNIEPSVSLSALQAGIDSLYVFKDQGEVVITADGSDPNGDALSYDWTQTDSGLGGTAVGNQYTFDASQTLPVNGSYQVGVVVSDGTAQISGLTTLVVAAAAPSLDGTDSDNDGIDDVTEGRADSDRDGLPDFQDPVDDRTLLNPRINTGADNLTRLIRSSAGVSLALGEFAVAAQRPGARISISDVTDADGQTVTDGNFNIIGGVFDFQILGLTSAQRAATVVLPLTQSIPNEASYRKFANNVWSGFVENGSDSIRSAASTGAECPPPGDAAYQPGLIPFNDCVELVLTDGGANDADGEANGVIRDPGGVAVSLPIPGSVNNPNPPPPPTRGPEGGGTVGWPSLLLLFLLLRYRKTGVGAE